jgi:hypothetical protein
MRLSEVQRYVVEDELAEASNAICCIAEAMSCRRIHSSSVTPRTICSIRA